MNNFNIELLEIAGFYSVLKALRLPFGKNMLSCADFRHRVYRSSSSAYIGTDSSILVDPKDLTFLSTLIKRDNEHAKVVGGLIVYAEITAPHFWWKEMDTYLGEVEKGLSVEELPTMQKRVEHFSYQTLRRIYLQINELPHWRTFCSFIESLPFAKELILCQREKK